MARIVFELKDAPDGEVEVTAIQDVSADEMAAPTEAMKMAADVITFLEINNQAAEKGSPIMLLK